MNKIKYLAVREWDQWDVATWLRNRHFENLCEKFVNEEITGHRLLLLSEQDLRSLVSQGIARKRLWRDLRNLMERMDYSDSEAEQTAASLERSSADLVVYTHRLVTAGLSTQNIHSIHNIPLRLSQAGVHSSLHVFKINEVFEREKVKLRSQVPVHITYDSKSQTFGSLVNIYLRLRGFPTTERQESPDTVHHANCLIVVLMDSHIDPKVESDIEFALNNGKRVLLVVGERLPLEEVDLNLEELEVVRWIHDYQKAGIDRIEKLITYNEESEEKACLKTRSISIDSGIDVCTKIPEY